MVNRGRDMDEVAQPGRLASCWLMRAWVSWYRYHGSLRRHAGAPTVGEEVPPHLLTQAGGVAPRN